MTASDEKKYNEPMFLLNVKDVLFNPCYGPGAQLSFVMGLHRDAIECARHEERAAIRQKVEGTEPPKHYTLEQKMAYKLACIDIAKLLTTPQPKEATQ